MVMFVVVALVVFVLYRLRGRRKSRLAGLTSSAPVFSISPPTRYTTSRRDHRL